jgi:endogenous inhibitor of DNA gyrase (YacG/DUF329 family)
MSDKQIPLRAVRLAPKCALCSKPAEEKYKPFCSKRCADIDLGRWLKESYVVPTDEGPGEEEPQGGRREPENRGGDGG